MVFYLLLAAFLVTVTVACFWQRYVRHLTALACILGACAVTIWLDDHGWLPRERVDQGRQALPIPSPRDPVPAPR